MKNTGCRILIAIALLLSFVALQIPETANASCDWSVGRYGYKDASGRIIVTGSNPLPAGQCTWGADGKTDRNGWDIVFRVSSGRDAYKWYTDNLILNAARGTIGYPGDLLIFNRSSAISGFGAGHVAFIISRGYWNGKRAWTVRHANWPGSFGQTVVETHCGYQIKQCTFVESSPGWVKIQNGNSLGATAYPILGFLYKK